MSGDPQADWTPEQLREFRDSLRLTFGAEAAMYERSRPTFAADAVDWLISPDARDVADVGAGTGKLTRLLADRGLTVTAVEPDPGMRAELTRVLPTVPCVEGSGESIPLPDDSLDLVTFAQSWHWVDVSAASAEVARVLRPGGRLALIWNMDARLPRWLAEGLRLDKPLEDDKLNPSVGPEFGSLEHRQFSWSETLPKATFIDRVLSRSRYLVLSARERAEEVEFIRAAMERDPEVAGHDDVVIHHNTEVFSATLRD